MNPKFSKSSLQNDDDKKDLLRPHFVVQKNRIGEAKKDEQADGLDVIAEKKEPVKKQRTRIKEIDEEVETTIDNQKTENGEALPTVLESKVLYTNIDDEVADIIAQIKKLPHKKISLVIPHRALLFKSSVNLHILNKKAVELKKNITIISHDEAGLTASQHAGIATRRELTDIKKKSISTDTHSQFMRGEKPSRMTREKKSIAEVIRPEEKRAAFESFLIKIKDKIQKKRKALSGTRVVFVSPNKQALFTLVLLSILLFLSIAYIALPGATITITPRESILESTFNVTFMDYDKNKSVFDNDTSPNLIVPTYPVDPPPFSKELTYIPTGKISRGDRARGILTVYNKTDHPWDLAATTRFQTEEGLIFRTPRAIRIPALTNKVPGTVEVEVLADDLDNINQVIGSRGNIDPRKFFLPGLQEDSRKNLYAENKAPFTGGVTRVIKVVSKEDVDAATETLKKKITSEAAADLKNYLEQQNLNNKTNFSLITDKNILKIGEPKISIPPNIVGQQIDQFKLNASYTIASVSYDKAILVKFLRSRMIHRADPDKKIAKISEDDLSYRFLEADAASGKVKLTVTMRAIQSFDLNPDTENGKRFIKKITDHLLGLRVDAAKDYLRQQTDEIAQVEVKTWPIWAPTIPNIADNIKFVVNDVEK